MADGVLRRLVAVLGLDFQQKDFDKADLAINNVKSQLGALVGLIAGSALANGFKNMVLGAVEAADAIDTTAIKLGLTTNALQELQYAAKLSNVNAESLGGSLRFLARNAAEAANGSKEARSGFGALGIGVTDAHGKVLPTEELLGRVAGAMEGVTEPAERVRLAMKIFGRDGASIIPMLTSGKAGLDALREEFRRLGGGFSPEFIAQAKEVDDNLDRLSVSYQGLKNMIVIEVLPALNSFVQWLIKGWMKLREFLGGTNFVRHGLMLLAVGAGIAAFVLGAKLLVALGGVAKAAAVAALGFGSAGNAALLMHLKAMLLGAVFLALIGLLVLIADEIKTFFEGGDTVMGRFSDKLSEIYDKFMAWTSVSPVINGILGPLKALVAFLKLSVDAFNALILAATGDFRGFNVLADNFKSAYADVAKTFSKAFALPEVAGLMNRPSAGSGPGALTRGVQGALDFADRLTGGGLGEWKNAAYGAYVPVSPQVTTSPTMVSSPTINLTQTVNAAPGQDAKTVGDFAGKMAADAIGREIDRAAIGLLPLASEGVR